MRDEVMHLAAKSLAENGESLLASWNREPERRRAMLRVGVATPPIVVLWAWWGHLILIQPLVMISTALLVALYGLTMAALSGWLVRNADLWQIESAAEARRLVGDRRLPGRSKAERSVDDSDGSGFHRLYFLFRLREEVKAARRIGAAMSVVVLQLTKPGATPSPALTEEVDFDVARLAADHVQTLRAPTAIGPLEYAFCLPDKDHLSTRALVHQLVGALGGYWCSFGISSYPEDGSRAEELLEAAREEAYGTNQKAA